MAKDCGHSVPCGCGDKALTTPPPCNVSGPCAGEKCSELFDQQCIVYTGPELRKEINGADFVILKGQRVDALIQKTLQALSSTDSEDFTDAPSNIQISNITSTGFTVTWEGDDALDYTFNAQQVVGAVNNILTPALGVYTVTFTGLVPGEQYELFSEQASGGWAAPRFILTLPA